MINLDLETDKTATTREIRVVFYVKYLTPNMGGCMCGKAFLPQNPTITTNISTTLPMGRPVQPSELPYDLPQKITTFLPQRKSLLGKEIE